MACATRLTPIRISEPRRLGMAENGKRDIILKVNDLKMHFPLRQGMLQRRVGTIKAVDGVSFELGEQEVMGLVGESGCGKTTVGRTLLRLYDPTGGEVLFHGLMAVGWMWRRSAARR